MSSGGHLNAQYNLRLPDELKQKIAHSSKELNRSMNADIVARLEESFTPNTASLSTENLLVILAERFAAKGCTFHLVEEEN